MSTHFGIAATLIAISAAFPFAQSSPADLSRRSTGLSAEAQRAKVEGAEADWLTDGGDPQRTAWQKNEHILNVSNVKGRQRRWKDKTDDEAREVHALGPPPSAGRAWTPAGPEQLALG